MDSSASGLTPISSRACRATARIASVSTSTPDSLAISMDIVVRLPLDSAPASGTATTGGTTGHGVDGLCGGLFQVGVVTRIGVNDLGDQPVAHDVGAGQLGEVHVLDILQDLSHDLEATGGAARQVDLGDVAGDHDLGTEPEPGQEHLHLLGCR